MAQLPTPLKVTFAVRNLSIRYDIFTRAQKLTIWPN